MKADIVSSLNKRVLSEPGLPPIVMTMEGLWQTGLRLPALYALKRQPPAPQPFGPEPIETALEDGEVLVSIPSREPAPSGQQLTALRTLEQLDAELAQASLEAVLQRYPAIRSQYDHLPDADFPPVATADDLRSLLDLRGIVIHTVAGSAWPYFGIKFKPSWDLDHGLGLMARGAEVIEVGGADTIMMPEIAEANHARRQGPNA